MAEGEMIVQARQADFSYQGRNWKGFRLQSAGGNSFYGRKLIWAAGARDCFPKMCPASLLAGHLTSITSPELIEQLGLELGDTPFLGTTVKRREPCDETNIPGVHVAGDAGTHAKQIVVAMAQGGYAVDSL